MQRRFENKRARFDYEITETFEAGLVLNGLEIKSARAGQVSLNGAFVRPLRIGSSGKTELWLINAHFTGAPEPDRTRKLLVHRRELDRLTSRINEKGYTIVPIVLYFTRGRLKIQVGLGKGKKQFEKRETIKKRDIERELKRGVKH